MFENAKLIIPSNISYLEIAEVFVKEIARKLGFSTDEIYKIELATEESIKNIITYSYSDEETGEIEIICKIILHSLHIIFKDRGMPFNPSSIPIYHPENPLEGDVDKGLSQYLIKHSVDNIFIRSLGREGIEIELVKDLPFKDITQYKIPEEIKAGLQAQKENFKEIRLLKEDEAIELSRLFYTSYGYTYVSEDVYYPEKIISHIQDGSLISLVGVSDLNRIISHIGLMKPFDKSESIEWGMAVTDPKMRGMGLINKLLDYAIKTAEEKSFKGIFAHCVTNHEYTQKTSSFWGFSDVAMLLAYAPATLKFRKITDELTQRETTLVGYKFLVKPEEINLFIPVKHMEIIRKLYNGLGYKPGFEHNEIMKIHEQHSIISTILKSDLNVGEIIIKQVGLDLLSSIKKSVNNLCIQRVDMIYLFIDLEDIYTPGIAKQIEEIGFFFAGIFPYYPFNHTLVYQFTNNIQIDFGKIQALSDIAKELLQYIKNEHENNN